MDGLLDILIPILFIVLPVVFKAIGNKLDSAGKSDKAGKFKKVAEAFEDEEDEDTLTGWLLEKMNQEEKPVEPVSIDPEPVVIPKPAVAEINVMDYIDKPATVVKRQITRIPPRPNVKARPMMLIEDEPERKKEKIDPKKLVIYSEIMKPKF